MIAGRETCRSAAGRACRRESGQHSFAGERHVFPMRLRLLCVLLLYCMPVLAVNPQPDARRFDAIRTGGGWALCAEGDCGPPPGCVVGAQDDVPDPPPAPPNAHVDFAVWPLSGASCNSDYIGTYACDSPFNVDAAGTQCQ